jgi:photosynthetic reaction center cytochrome c subunit
MKTRLIGFAAAALLTGTAAILTAPSAAQPATGTPVAPPKQEFVWPARISNAQVLPADIGADRLRATMVRFSRSLGVRCQFCHVGQEGQPLSTFNFASDANPHKNVARGMIRLVQRLNVQDLPPLVGPSEQLRVTCYTCHRGSYAPETMLPPPPPRPGSPPPPAVAPPPPAHPGH